VADRLDDVFAKIHGRNVRLEDEWKMKLDERARRCNGDSA
jgi:hypothetical protein